MIGTRKMEVDLPCGVFYNLSNILLDLDGTLAVDGKLVEGVIPRLKQLSEVLNIHVFTEETNRALEELVKNFADGDALTIQRLESGRGDSQKLAILDKLGREQSVAVGNGCDDAMMLREAALGICIIGKEGTSVDALKASKAVFLDICDALDIFIKRNRMIATLRH